MDEETGVILETDTEDVLAPLLCKLTERHKSPEHGAVDPARLVLPPEFWDTEVVNKVPVVELTRDEPGVARPIEVGDPDALAVDDAD